MGTWRRATDQEFSDRTKQRFWDDRKKAMSSPNLESNEQPPTKKRGRGRNPKSSTSITIPWDDMFLSIQSIATAIHQTLAQWRDTLEMMMMRQLPTTGVQVKQNRLKSRPNRLMELLDYFENRKSPSGVKDPLLPELVGAAQGALYLQDFLMDQLESLWARLRLDDKESNEDIQVFDDGSSYVDIPVFPETTKDGCTIMTEDCDVVNVFSRKNKVRSELGDSVCEEAKKWLEHEDISRVLICLDGDDQLSNSICSNMSFLVVEKKPLEALEDAAKRTIDNVRAAGRLPEEDQDNASTGGYSPCFGESSRGLRSSQNFSRGTELSMSEELGDIPYDRRTDMRLSDIQRNAPRPYDDESDVPFSVPSKLRSCVHSHCHGHRFESRPGHLRFETCDIENTAFAPLMANRFSNDPQAERHVSSENRVSFSSRSLAAAQLPLQIVANSDGTNPKMEVKWLRNTIHSLKQTKLVIFIALCSVTFVVVVIILQKQKWSAPSDWQVLAKWNQFGHGKHCFVTDYVLLLKHARSRDR
jgi:hypothetical protein